MRYYAQITVFLLAIALAGCAQATPFPTETAIPTIAATLTQTPTATTRPTKTPVPTATHTPEPSPTKNAGVYTILPDSQFKYDPSVWNIARAAGEENDYLYATIDGVPCQIVQKRPTGFSQQPGEVTLGKIDYQFIYGDFKFEGPFESLNTDEGFQTDLPYTQFSGGYHFVSYFTSNLYGALEGRSALKQWETCKPAIREVLSTLKFQ